MRNRSPRPRDRVWCLSVCLLSIPTLKAPPCTPQTASTSALIGEALAPSGQGIAGATVDVPNESIRVSRSRMRDDEGRFVLTLLPRGTYHVTAQKSGYSKAESKVIVSVTESVRLSIPMKIAGLSQSKEVHAEASALQTDSVALGRVIKSRMLEGLPLATRHSTQIVDLRPGLLTAANNAGELGPGGSGLAQISRGNDGIFAHGLRSYDNSHEYDGVPVTDLQARYLASGGIPILSPDAIQEFKVQTGLYDVSFGEHAGANAAICPRKSRSGCSGRFRRPYTMRQNIVAKNTSKCI